MRAASKLITYSACLLLLACAPNVAPKNFEARFAKGVAAYDAGAYEDAFAYWLPLADNYDLAAMRNIGHLYRLGQGVAQNSKKALSYYKRAAIIGYAPAQYNLGMMYWQADGVAYDRDEASKWLSMAAQQAYPRARAWQERQNMTMTPMPDAPTRGGEK